MATTTIPWGDGSGDNIYLTYPSASGDQTVEVSSDANTGSARSKVVTFSAPGASAVSLTINQDASLPYTQLSYIETDGVAYIDSGVLGITPRSIELNVTPVLPASGNTYIMGSRKNSGNTRLVFLLVNANGRAGFAFGSNVYNNTSNAINCSASANNKTMMLVRCSFSNTNKTFGVKQAGESSYTTKSISSSYTLTNNTYSIGIFAINTYGYFSVAAKGTRIEYVKIWDNYGYNGDLLFDGVACLYNGEYGLWDKVSNSFFGNSAASGAFTGPA